MKVLMILTSHDKLGNTDQKTGFWLEEFAAPYYAFKDNKADITLASPKGGNPPLDPKSNEDAFQTDTTRRLLADKEVLGELANTKRIADIEPEEYDAVFYPGGHGPLWDLVDNKDSIKIIKSFYNQQKPLGFVCHAPAVLKGICDKENNSLVKDKKVTGFSNSEEKAVGLTEIVPFLVEDMLSQSGGKYQKGEDWQEFVCVEGILVTGQNPASSKKAALELLKLINNK